MNTAAVVTPPLSLEAFFAFDDGTDMLYELDNGELIAMPPESDLNERIAIFLLLHLGRVGIAPKCLRTKTEIVVSGARITVRIPDLIVLSDELATAMAGASRSTVMLEMPPPPLVVEVVSPGKKNQDQDYRYKRSQYEARGIQEYWIVDPIAQQVTVLVLDNGLYESTVVTGDTKIPSPFLERVDSQSNLTAAQVLGAGITQ